MAIKLGTLAAGALALIGAQAVVSTAMAQTTLTGIRAVNDQLEDVERDVTRDMNRAEDAARYGSPEYRPGFSGSASLGYSGKTGNNESQDIDVGIRLRHAQGNFVQSLGAVLDFGEVDNSSTKKDVLVVYDANYYFDQNWYGFVLGRLQSDGLASTADDIRRDAFIGFGPGYRIINTQDVTWRVQAGIGVSYLQNGLRQSETETGYLASSRFFYRFNDNFYVTNDTDVLKSDIALRVNNDLGLNVKMTDTISTRISYLTDYNESRAIRTDNKLGVSMVFSF